jgi:hypothetical protein
MLSIDLKYFIEISLSLLLGEAPEEETLLRSLEVYGEFGLFYDKIAEFAAIVLIDDDCCKIG